MKKTKSKAQLAWLLTLFLVITMFAGSFTVVLANEGDAAETGSSGSVSASAVETPKDEETPGESQSDPSEPSVDSEAPTESSIQRILGELPAAAPASADLLVYSKTLDGIHAEFSNGHVETDHWRKEIAGMTAYCVELGVSVGEYYDGTQVSDELYYRMSLADYWGRHVYGDTNETNFYVQLYIWELLGDTVVALSGPTVSLEAYHAWKAAIEPAINAFFTPPSFAGQTLTLRAGQSVTLTDTNGSLAYYSVLADSIGLSYSQNGNTLQLTTSKHCNDGQIRFIYETDPSFVRPMYYWSDGQGSQDIFTTGIEDPATFLLTIQFRRFNVTVSKTDAETASQQGDASLAGAVYGMYDVDWNLLDTYATNASGRFTTNYYLVVVGEPYYIKEISPSPGYLLDDTVYAINTDAEAMPNLLNTLTRTVKEDVIRGGVRIEKWDNEIDEHRAQGGATLAGAVFDIYNSSAKPVLVDGELYDVGDIVTTITTDENGVAETASDLLPYGTYEAIESEPPEGYLPTGVLSRTFTIREEGVIVDLNTSYTAIKNNPIRGDIRGVKISDGDAQRLAGVPFRITSATTGESHVVVTDANGQFDTASSWNLHSQNTNRGETDLDGIWFGEIETLNDDLGALLYDTYIIEELRCESNAAYALLPPFEVKLYRDSVTINLGTLTNDYTEEEVPWIGTTAVDSETRSHLADVSGQTTIIDYVEYTGLKVWREYTLEGILMDTATGKPLLVDGEPVISSVTFKPEAADGQVEVTFTFDSTALAGRSVTVFEYLTDNETGKEIASHEDIEDEGQTVTFNKAPVVPRAVVPQTGDNGILRNVIMLVLAAAALFSCAVIVRRKFGVDPKNENDEPTL